MQTIGMIGLGIMGTALSTNLLKAGFPVVGFDVLAERRDALIRNKGQGSASCQEVAQQADIILTSLPSVKALQQVVEGPEGLLTNPKEGLIVIETSTLPLEVKHEAYEKLKSAGIEMLDCPLSGTGAQAVNKDLIVYASGDPQACEQCKTVFDGFSRGHYYVGEFGTGSKMKFIANLLVTIHNVAAAEALVLGMKSGLDPKLVYEVISAGAGTSRMFEVRGPMMVENHYDEATMKMDVYQKDIEIINAFANALHCPTPLMSAASQVYMAGLAKGLDKQDTASVCKVLEEMAGITRNNDD